MPRARREPAEGPPKGLEDYPTFCACQAWGEPWNAPRSSEVLILKAITSLFLTRGCHHHKVPHGAMPTADTLMGRDTSNGAVQRFVKGMYNLQDAALTMLAKFRRKWGDA